MSHLTVNDMELLDRSVLSNYIKFLASRYSSELIEQTVKELLAQADFTPSELPHSISVNQSGLHILVTEIEDLNKTSEQTLGNNPYLVVRSYHRGFSHALEWVKSNIQTKIKP